jgi:hypothetical protein
MFLNKRCEEYIRVREHLDLDSPPPQLWEHQWEQFLTEYYTLTQGGAKIQVQWEHFLTEYYTLTQGGAKIQVQWDEI